MMLVITAGLIIATSDAGSLMAEGTPPSTLPWLATTITTAFWSQSCLVIGLAALTAAQSWSRRNARQRDTNRNHDLDPIDTLPAWRGLAVPAFALLGWVVGNGFSAALALRVADIVGSPVAQVDTTSRTSTAAAGMASPMLSKQILVPVGYFWAAAAAAPVLLIAVVMAGALVVHVRRTAKHLETHGLRTPIT